jgi:signal transduction histidine kinase
MRLKLILMMTIVVIVAIVGVVLFMRVDQTQQVQNYFMRGGMAGIDDLVAQLEIYYNETSTWDGVETVFEQYALHSTMGMNAMGNGGMRGQALMLADESGHVFYETKNSGFSVPSPQTVLETGIQLISARKKVVGYLFSPNTVIVQQNQGQKLLLQLNTAAYEAGAVAIVIAILLALLLTHQILKPVQQLTTAARNMTSGNLTQRVEVHGKDEIAELANSFNLMADSIAQSEDRRKAMTADIAHELRTPLTVQRASLEAMQDGVYPVNQENIQTILDQNLVLTRLVEDLRTLALVDAGELKLEYSPFEINPMLKKVIERFEPYANKHDVQIILEEAPDSQSIYFNGDSVRIGQIISNLLSNALKFSPENSSVTVRVQTNPGYAIISVRDQGPGIPESQLPELFERFYRGDLKHLNGEGGTGLGLAISRQLALAHGGDLIAENHPAGGALFSLRLPISA